MGLFSKHKAKGVALHFYVHVHSLGPFPTVGPLAVEWQRGSRRGATRPAQPTRQPGKVWANYDFEESQHIPCTLYEDPAAKGRRGAYERKELALQLVVGGRGGRVLGTLSLNLADWAGSDRTQQALPVQLARGVAAAAAGPPKLLVTISCTESAGAAPVVAAGSSFSEVGDLPTSMSTDDEGSRPASRTSDSRPSSRLEGLPPKGPSAQAAAAGAAAVLGARAANGQGAAVLSPVEEGEGEAGGRSATFESEGFLRDSSIEGEASAAAAAAQPAVSATEGASASSALGVTGGSVKRNLGSALERAGSSEEGSSGAGGGRLEGEEVESRPAAFAAGSPARGALAVLGTSPGALVRSPSRGNSGRSLGSARSFSERMREEQGKALPDDGAEAYDVGEDHSLDDMHAAAVLSAPQHQEAAVAAGAAEADTPLDAARRGDLASPMPWSTGQSSLSAGVDPAVPFTVRPSTVQRRFVRDDGLGGSRRWAWRQQPGRGSPDKPPAGARGAAAGAAAAAAATGPHRLAAQSQASEDTLSHEQPSQAESAQHSSAAAAAGERPDSPFAAASGAAAAAAAAVAAAGAAATGRASPSRAHRGPHSGGGGGSRLQSEGSVERFRLAPSREESLMLALNSPHNSLPAPVAEGSVEALLRELRATAALESAVYLAGGRSTFRHAHGLPATSEAAAAAEKRLHAPARRLARTVISLGRGEGQLFAMRALKAVQAVSGAAEGDLHRLTFWWSNVLQLRWMMWALQDPQQPEAGPGAAGGAGGGELGYGGSAEAAWLAEVLAPALLDLETQLFDEMLKLLWWGVLLQSVTGGSAAGRPPASTGPSPHPSPVPNGRAAQPTPVRRHSSDASAASRVGSPGSFSSLQEEEQAVRAWLRGLDVVQRVLTDPYRPAPAPRGHLQLLHQQLIVALLRRLDTLLFRKLLAGPNEDRGAPGSFSGGRGILLRSTSFMEDVLGGAPLPLDAALLPFARGPLTCSVGVTLKMAVGQLTQWAAEAGVKEDKVARSSHELSDYRLFPCLRATADLLMMPKEVLTDMEIRREVVPGLPLRRVVQILERFEPDELAPTPVPPGLLDQLQNETPSSAAPTSPTAKRSEEYAPPSEATLLEEGLIGGAAVSLRMDDESDDELEALAELLQGGTEEDDVGGPGGQALGGGAGGGRASRFALLKNLWSRAR